MSEPQSPTLAPRDVRRLAGWPMHKLALIAHVSPSTVRIFEANPSAVRDPTMRARLHSVYTDLAALVL